MLRNWILWGQMILRFLGIKKNVIICYLGHEILSYSLICYKVKNVFSCVKKCKIPFGIWHRWDLKLMWMDDSNKLIFLLCSTDFCLCLS
jgi:hypothetical protein